MASLRVPYRSPDGGGQPQRAAGDRVEPGSPGPPIHRSVSRLVPRKSSDRAPKQDVFGASTRTGTVAYALAPRLSVTVRVAVKVPGVVYVWVASRVVAVPPSPKSQAYVSGVSPSASVAVPSKATVTGAVPVAGVAVAVTTRRRVVGDAPADEVHPVDVEQRTGCRRPGPGPRSTARRSPAPVTGAVTSTYGLPAAGAGHGGRGHDRAVDGAGVDLDPAAGAGRGGPEPDLVMPGQVGRDERPPVAVLDEPDVLAAAGGVGGGLRLHARVAAAGAARRPGRWP